MKPIKVEFINEPKIKPITEYERKWWVLWLIPVSNPKYKLQEDMEVLITFDNGKVFNIVVKKDYECDLASIPRIFWTIYPPDGLYRYIAILHDILYQSEWFSREINDMIFKVGMHEDVPKSTRNIFYNAVRVGGWAVYKGHTKESICEAKKYIKVRKLV